MKRWAAILLTIPTTISAAAVLAATAGAAGDDPGDLPDSAADVTVTDGGASIRGALGSSGDVDLYEICLGPSLVATTQNFGTSDDDLRLFLFDGSGLPVRSVDDSAADYRPAMSTLVTPGTHYLAVASAMTEAYGATGQLFFGDALAKAEPLTRWVASGGFTGDYQLDMTGLVPCGAEPVTDTALTVDVKPGTDGVAPIKASARGTTPLAILGSDAFDVATIDAASVQVTAGDTTVSPDRAVSIEDVDGDGFADLVAHVSTPALGLGLTDTELCVTVTLLDGTTGSGCDAILVR